MNKIHIYIVVIILFSLVSSCKNKSKTNKSTSILTQIELETKKHNFGKIKEGEIVSFFIKYKNTGDKSLVIKDIKTDCGCTAVNYPKKPLGKGKSEKIEIIFNSEGRKGKQYKEITIFANIPNNTVKVGVYADIIE